MQELRNSWLQFNDCANINFLKKSTFLDEFLTIHLSTDALLFKEEFNFSEKTLMSNSLASYLILAIEEIVNGAAIEGNFLSSDIAVNSAESLDERLENMWKYLSTERAIRILASLDKIKIVSFAENEAFFHLMIELLNYALNQSEELFTSNKYNDTNKFLPTHCNYKFYDWLRIRNAFIANIAANDSTLKIYCISLFEPKLTNNNYYSFPQSSIYLHDSAVSHIPPTSENLNVYCDIPDIINIILSIFTENFIPKINHTINYLPSLHNLAIQLTMLSFKMLNNILTHFNLQNVRTISVLTKLLFSSCQFISIQDKKSDLITNLKYSEKFNLFVTTILHKLNQSESYLHTQLALSTTLSDLLLAYSYIVLFICESSDNSRENVILELLGNVENSLVYLIKQDLSFDIYRALMCLIVLMKQKICDKLFSYSKKCCPIFTAFKIMFNNFHYLNDDACIKNLELFFHCSMCTCIDLEFVLYSLLLNIEKRNKNAVKTIFIFIEEKVLFDLERIEHYFEEVEDETDNSLARKIIENESNNNEWNSISIYLKYLNRSVVLSSVVSQHILVIAKNGNDILMEKLYANIISKYFSDIENLNVIENVELSANMLRALTMLFEKNCDNHSVCGNDSNDDMSDVLHRFVLQNGTNIFEKFVNHLNLSFVAYDFLCALAQSEQNYRLSTDRLYTTVSSVPSELPTSEFSYYLIDVVDRLITDFNNFENRLFVGKDKILDESLISDVVQKTSSKKKIECDFSFLSEDENRENLNLEFKNLEQLSQLWSAIVGRLKKYPGFRFFLSKSYFSSAAKQLFISLSNILAQISSEMISVLEETRSALLQCSQCLLVQSLITTILKCIAELGLYHNDEFDPSMKTLFFENDELNEERIHAEFVVLCFELLSQYNEKFSAKYKQLKNENNSITTDEQEDSDINAKLRQSEKLDNSNVTDEQEDSGINAKLQQSEKFDNSSGVSENSNSSTFSSTTSDIDIKNDAVLKEHFSILSRLLIEICLVCESSKNICVQLYEFGFLEKIITFCLEIQSDHRGNEEFFASITNLWITIGQYKIRSSDLRQYFILFKYEDVPVHIFVPPLTKLFKSYKSDPLHYLCFKASKSSPPESPTLLDSKRKSFMSSIMSISSYVEVNVPDTPAAETIKNLRARHLRLGLDTCVSKCCVACPVPRFLDWSVYNNGVSVSGWFCFENNNSKPSCDYSKFFEHRQMEEICSNKTESCLHLFSIGDKHSMFSVYVDNYLRKIIVTCSTELESSKYKIEEIVFIDDFCLEFSKWQHFGLIVPSYNIKRRSIVKIQLIVNGISLQEGTFNLESNYFVKKSSSSYLLVGQNFNEKSSNELNSQNSFITVFVGKIFVFRDSVLNQQNCLGLISLGKDANSLLIPCNEPHKILFSSVINKELLHSDVICSFLFKDLRLLFTPLMGNLIIQFSPMIMPDFIYYKKTMHATIDLDQTYQECASQNSIIFSPFETIKCENAMSSLLDIGGSTIILFLIARVAELATKLEVDLEQINTDPNESTSKIENFTIKNENILRMQKTFADTISLIYNLCYRDPNFKLQFSSCNGSNLICRLIVSSKCVNSVFVLKALLEACVYPSVFEKIDDRTFLLSVQEHSYVTDRHLLDTIIMNWKCFIPRNCRENSAYSVDRFRVVDCSDRELFGVGAILGTIKVLLQSSPYSRFNLAQFRDVKILGRIVNAFEEMKAEGIKFKEVCPHDILVDVISLLISGPCDSVDQRCSDIKKLNSLSNNLNYADLPKGLLLSKVNGETLRNLGHFLLFLHSDRLASISFEDKDAYYLSHLSSRKGSATGDVAMDFDSKKRSISGGGVFNSKFTDLSLRNEVWRNFDLENDESLPAEEEGQDVLSVDLSTKFGVNSDPYFENSQSEKLLDLQIPDLSLNYSGNISNLSCSSINPLIPHGDSTAVFQGASSHESYSSSLNSDNYQSPLKENIDFSFESFQSITHYLSSESDLSENLDECNINSDQKHRAFLKSSVSLDESSSAFRNSPAPIDILKTEHISDSESEMDSHFTLKRKVLNGESTNKGLHSMKIISPSTNYREEIISTSSRSQSLSLQETSTKPFSTRNFERNNKLDHNTVKEPNFKEASLIIMGILNSINGALLLMSDTQAHMAFQDMFSIDLLLVLCNNLVTDVRVAAVKLFRTMLIIEGKELTRLHRRRNLLPLLSLQLYRHFDANQELLNETLALALEINPYSNSLLDQNYEFKTLHKVTLFMPFFAVLPLASPEICSNALCKLLKIFSFNNNFEGIEIIQKLYYKTHFVNSILLAIRKSVHCLPVEMEIYSSTVESSQLQFIADVIENAKAAICMFLKIILPCDAFISILREVVFHVGIFYRKEKSRCGNEQYCVKVFREIEGEILTKMVAAILAYASDQDITKIKLKSFSTVKETEANYALKKLSNLFSKSNSRNAANKVVEVPKQLKKIGQLIKAIFQMSLQFFFITLKHRKFTFKTSKKFSFDLLAEFVSFMEIVVDEEKVQSKYPIRKEFVDIVSGTFILSHFWQILTHLISLDVDFDTRTDALKLVTSLADFKSIIKYSSLVDSTIVYRFGIFLHALRTDLSRFHKEDNKNFIGSILNMIDESGVDVLPPIDRDCELQEWSIVKEVYLSWKREIKCLVGSYQHLKYLDHSKFLIKLEDRIVREELRSEASWINWEVLGVRNKRLKRVLKRIKDNKCREIKHTYSWKDIVEVVTNEKGPWCFPERIPGGWELDSTETSLRIRKRLMRCHMNVAPKHLHPHCADRHKITEPPLESLLKDNEVESALNRIVDSIGEDENLVHTCHALIISPTVEEEGEFLVGYKHIYFISESVTFKRSNKAFRVASKVWSLDVIREIHPRRYQLNDCAIEIFSTNGKNALFTFSNNKERNKVIEIFDSLNFPNLKLKLSLGECTEAWKEGVMTNFEYLTQLNKFGGRSFNDLMQYPVFPFILKNYDSHSLDLNDASIYRDLRKPTAIQNEERTGNFKDTYEASKSICEMGPYHYCSHYSNSGIVLYYLVRLPPFTQLFLDFQDGNFDAPDRSFYSLGVTWQLINDSTTAIRELIPEFFYLPEFLVNAYSFNLGVRQCGEMVNHVQLPKWCQNDSRKFVLVHRALLESAYVTKNLKNWIDLIFGYKQTGKAAVKAINVFHPATYFGFDVQASDDDDQISIEARKTMVRTYGQSPKQLLFTPHPSSSIKYPQLEISSIVPPVMADVIGLRWGSYAGSPSDLKISVQLVQTSKYYVEAMINLANHEIVLLPSKTKLYTIKLKSGDYMELKHFVISWGDSDGVARYSSMKKNETHPLITFHDFIAPTCCVTSQKQFWFGTKSGQIQVYLLNYSSEFRELFANTPSHPLLAHSEAVTCMTISQEFKVCFSGSKDGMVALWDVNKISYIRSVFVLDADIKFLAVSETLGDWVSVYFKTNDFKSEEESLANDRTKATDQKESCKLSGKVQPYQSYKETNSVLRYYTINCEFIESAIIPCEVTCLVFSSAPEGRNVNVLAVGCSDKNIRLFSTWNLSLVRILSFARIRSAPRTIFYSESNRHLCVACEDKTLIVWESSRGIATMPKFISL